MRENLNEAIKVHKIGPIKYRFLTIFRLFTIIHRLKPNLIISFLDGPNLVNSIASLIFSHNCVVSERSKIDTTKFSTKIRFLVYRIAKPKLVVNSIRIKNQLVNEQIKVINSVCIYNILPPKIINTEPDLCLNRTIVMLANYRQEKQQLEFIEALNGVTRYPIIKLFGNTFLDSSNGFTSNYYSECVQRLSDLNLARVHLNGLTNNVIDTLSDCSAIILTSEYEGFPNVICEAMGMGKVIITSKVSDVELWIDHSVNGYLLDTHLETSLEKAFDWFLGLSDMDLKRISNHNRNLALRLFNKDNCRLYG